MKKVNFKSITIKNFLSAGEEPLEVDFSSGLNVINGVNRDEDNIANGVGKSLILDAFYFAIFGNTMRELSKLSFIVNRKSGKNCVVKLDFEVIDTAGLAAYTIERKLAPQGLKLWKNGVEVTKSTTAETNKFIEEIISADKDIFQNCILMRANNTTPFMAKKKQEKKNFIENIFKLDIFSTMTKLLKDDIRETKSKYNIEQNASTLHESNINNYRRQLDALVEDYQTQLDNKQKHIDELLEKIDAEEKRKLVYIDEIAADQKSLPSAEEAKTVKKRCDEALSRLQPVKSKLSVELGITQRDLNRLEKSEDSCPTCKRRYSQEHLDDVHKQIEDLRKKLNELTMQFNAVSDKVGEVEGKKNAVESIIADVRVMQAKVEHKKSEIDKCDKIIAMCRDGIARKEGITEPMGIANFRKLINDTENTLKNVKSTIDLLEKELGKMNICEHILGEYGVRAYIVNQLLELFNGRIMHYLRAIKSTFNFRFNEFFEEEIKDANGIICLYNNCSGAEMKKIDLAISFAINDMLSLQKQISYNVLFFDEILDSSLDDKSLNIILNFISEHTLNENKAVYIISHKSGAQIPFINEVITLEKNNGFTKRIYN